MNSRERELLRRAADLLDQQHRRYLASMGVDVDTADAEGCEVCPVVDDIRALLAEPQGELQANSKPEQNLELEPQYVWL
jgi:hypothetical protein